VLDLTKLKFVWGDLQDRWVYQRREERFEVASGRGVDRKFVIAADDISLVADGADTTRVVLRVTDEFGAMRTYANDPVSFTLEGPGGC